MQKVEWDNAYLIGIEEVDAQHKRLIQIANELYDAINLPTRYQENMREVVQKLMDYTDYHFKSEEKFMKKYNYPQSEIHIAAHKNFKREMEHQTRQLSIERIEDGLNLYSYIVNWVLNHIAKADKIWGDYVIEHMRG